MLPNPDDERDVEMGFGAYVIMGLLLGMLMILVGSAFCFVVVAIWAAINWTLKSF